MKGFLTNVFNVETLPISIITGAAMGLIAYMTGLTDDPSSFAIGAAIGAQLGNAISDTFFGDSNSPDNSGPAADSSHNSHRPMNP